jgi:hypothetical protein
MKLGKDDLARLLLDVKFPLTPNAPEMAKPRKVTKNRQKQLRHHANARNACPKVTRLSWNFTFSFVRIREISPVNRSLFYAGDNFPLASAGISGRVDKLT